MEARFYRQLEHTGDCAIEVFAPSRPELFRNCALAFSDLVVGLARIDATRQIELEVAGRDDLALLFNLYDELIFRFDVEGFIAASIDVVVCEAARLVLRAAGEAWEREKHDYHVAIKAPTYHQMAFAPFDEGWRAQIVFDL